MQGLHNPVLALSVQMSAKTDKNTHHVDADMELSPTAVVIDKNRTRMLTYFEYILYN